MLLFCIVIAILTKITFIIAMPIKYIIVIIMLQAMLSAMSTNKNRNVRTKEQLKVLEEAKS